MGVLEIISGVLLILCSIAIIVMVLFTGLIKRRRSERPAV